MRLFLWIAFVTLIGSSIGIAAGYVAFRPARSTPADTTAIETTIGGTTLRYDAAYDPRGGHTGANVVLVALFPDLRPARSVAADDPRKVVLRLQPQSNAIDPADRTTKLYSSFLTGDMRPQANGLVMRPFERGSPYETEDLYLAPPEGRSFFARCTRPSPSPDGLPNSCVTEFRQNRLDIQITYGPTLLDHWEDLIDRAHWLVSALVR